MNISDIKLNENQQNAVDWSEGPLLVLAGPGSGKTLVLTIRAARLLKENEDTSVLALTFTTKAADEMRERLDKLMGGRADRAHLCTYHSFAGDILRQHGSHVGIQPDFSVITLDEDRVLLLDQAIKDQEIDSALLPMDRRNILTLIDRLFAESYNGEPTASGLAHTPQWVPDLFRAYCNNLQKCNRLDFGGLLHFAKKLLSDNAGVSRLTRLAWQYVCVDEFQDTNRAQYDLLKLLVGVEQPNLYVVADDDQIIYQWNGASPERLNSLRRDYEMNVIQLPENHRCPPIIIQMANCLIEHNQNRSPGKKPLVACKPAEESEVLRATVYPDEDYETSAVAKIIKESGWAADDCVILARSSKLLEKAAKALEDTGLQAYLAQRKNEFESPAVRWFHAALRLANTRHDRELLRRLCVAWQALTGELIEVEAIEASAVLNGGDFLRTWIEVVQNSESNESRKTLLGNVLKNLVDRLTFIDLLEWFWSKEWVEDDLEKEEINTWKELHGALLREHSLENLTLNLYLQELDLKSKAAPRLSGSIPCLTVHGAKGLEFKNVFLIGMADSVFPSYYAVKNGPKSREMEEERRNCFVAITRVQETLHISWAKSYNGYGKRPSRFLKEMGFSNV